MESGFAAILKELSEVSGLDPTQRAAIEKASMAPPETPGKTIKKATKKVTIVSASPDSGATVFDLIARNIANTKANKPKFSLRIGNLCKEQAPHTHQPSGNQCTDMHFCSTKCNGIYAGCSGIHYPNVPGSIDMLTRSYCSSGITCDKFIFGLCRFHSNHEEGIRTEVWNRFSSEQLANIRPDNFNTGNKELVALFHEQIKEYIVGLIQRWKNDFKAYAERVHPGVPLPEVRRILFDAQCDAEAHAKEKRRPTGKSTTASFAKMGLEGDPVMRAVPKPMPQQMPPPIPQSMPIPPPMPYPYPMMPPPSTSDLALGIISEVLARTSYHHAFPAPPPPPPSSQPPPSFGAAHSHR